MHVLHAPRGSDFFHDFNRFLEERVSHGTEIEPLFLSQAGLTKWMGIEWVAHSVAPSIWGWNAVDMSSLVPMSLFSSHQNVDMNLVSQSDTIHSGTPLSLMTSLRNSHATSFAVTHVIVGTRCTCDMSRSMITNR